MSTAKSRGRDDFAASIELMVDHQHVEDEFRGSVLKMRRKRPNACDVSTVMENRWDNYVTDTRKAFISKPQNQNAASGATAAAAGTSSSSSNNYANASNTAATAPLKPVEEWDFSDLRQAYVSMYHLVRNLDEVTDDSLRAYAGELSQPVKQGLINSISLNHRSNEFSSALGAVDLSPRDIGDVKVSADAQMSLYTDGDRSDVLRTMDVAKERAAARSEKMNKRYTAAMV